MEQNQAAEKQERPEFGKLIDRISIEADGALELSSRIINLVRILMPLEESAPIQESPSPVNDGIIGLLWEKVEKIRRANLCLEETLHHLEKIVGRE